ncbi:MAG TPA: VOC family protein [Actinomycetota bacterium]|nr:VOC family protein [Actinomycetota bacterium]
MSTRQPATGSIVWTDLSVPPEKVPAIRDFYEAVTGWKSVPVNMGSYDDFNMTLPETGKTVAAICHAKGGNAGLPAQWLMYIVVENLDVSVAECWAQGGRVLVGPKDVGNGERFCVIRDPAGAVAALIQENPAHA